MTDWTSLTDLVEQLLQQHPAVVLAALAGAAAVEYVFPPFPGDTVVLAGAALVAAYGWPVAPVFIALTAGAAAGSMTAWWVGARWLRRRATTASERSAGLRQAIAHLERRGTAYLLLNRFLPGVRAFFFVGAGIAGMRFSVVLFWGLLSAVAWNAVLLAVGFWVGRNVEGLEGLMRDYNLVAGGIVLVSMVLMALAYWRLSKKKGE